MDIMIVHSYCWCYKCVTGEVSQGILRQECSYDDPEMHTNRIIVVADLAHVINDFQASRRTRIFTALNIGYIQCSDSAEADRGERLHGRLSLKCYQHAYLIDYNAQRRFSMSYVSKR
jgi:hypothetical protein